MDLNPLSLRTFYKRKKEGTIQRFTIPGHDYPKPLPRQLLSRTPGVIICNPYKGIINITQSSATDPIQQ